MTALPFHMEQLLVEYASQLKLVGGRINLVSAQDLKHLEERHIHPCRAFARLAQDLRPRCVLDLGSGGGLPGIPVAILNPEARVLLCESVGKKAEFLDRVIRRLGLLNVQVLNCRIEALELPDLPDLITARFFGSVEDILAVTGSLRTITTRLLLIKGEEESLPGTCRDYALQETHPIGYRKRAVLYTHIPPANEGTHP